MSDWLTVIRTELFWTLHETLTKSRTSFLSVKRIINQDQHSDQETEIHWTKCLWRSRTKLWTEYCATEAIVSVMFEKVTSHLAQEAKCSQLFVTTLYPPPPPPAADPLSKPSTELRALSTTFFSNDNKNVLPTSTDVDSAHLFTMKGWKLDVSRVVDSCPARCPDWPQRFYKHPGKGHPRKGHPGKGHPGKGHPDLLFMRAI